MVTSVLPIKLIINEWNQNDIRSKLNKIYLKQTWVIDIQAVDERDEEIKSKHNKWNPFIRKLKHEILDRWITLLCFQRIYDTDNICFYYML